MDNEILADGFQTAPELWVFGYGSLMWNPDFPFESRVRGRCHGVHRSFCVRSVYHRGSYVRPGLVLGLDGGGSCDGVLFKVPQEVALETVRYLRRREQVTRVYREVYRSVEIEGSSQRVRALCFVASKNHTQYVNSLSISHQAKIIQRSWGKSGTNLDYLISTVQHLEELGIEDRPLQRILALTGNKFRLGSR